MGRGELKCGKVMLTSVQREMRDLPKRFRPPRVTCGLEPGHEGNHVAETKTARYEWWNEERNPQHQSGGVK